MVYVLCSALGPVLLSHLLIAVMFIPSVLPHGWRTIWPCPGDDLSLCYVLFCRAVFNRRPDLCADCDLPHFSLFSRFFLFLSFLLDLVFVLIFVWPCASDALRFHDISWALCGEAPRPPIGRPGSRWRICGAPRESADSDYQRPEFREP